MDNTTYKIFEETSLNAIHKVLIANLDFKNVEFADLRLLFRELPNILESKIPVVDSIRGICIELIPKMMKIYGDRRKTREHIEMNSLMNMLKAFDTKK